MAMVFPAQKGYLVTIQYLIANRLEGCSAYAKEFAAVNGHFGVFEWLHENRSEPFAVDLTKWERQDRKSYNRIVKCPAFYTKQDRLERVVDKFMKDGDFEMLDLLHPNNLALSLRSL